MNGPDRNQVIGRLRAHEQELRAQGVVQLSLFGSVARGEAGPASDIDVAIRFDPARLIGLFQFAALADRLEEMLGAKVDLITEPIEKDRLRAHVERDRALVF